MKVEWDETLARPATIEMPVQVNGKVRARIEVEVDAGQEEIESLALEQPNVKAHVQDQKPKNLSLHPICWAGRL